jgi:hypothetical protein
MTDPIGNPLAWRDMKKFAVCVALDVITTGASVTACKTARPGFDARYPPIEAAALAGPFVGQLKGFQTPRSIRNSGRTRMGLPRAS